MEFIRINDEKLKIMLSRDDLEEFDVRADELDYSNTETKRMFWDILGRAKRNVGFSCDGMRILVQLYSSRDGGCEMFVSKLGKKTDEYITNDEYEPELHCKTLYKRDGEDARKGAFGFDLMEHLISVCRRLFDIGYSGSSSAYIGDDRRFYLFLDDLDATGYFVIDEYSFIAEYGTHENIEALTHYLGEHGRMICNTDAVETLGAL